MTFYFRDIVAFTPFPLLVPDSDIKQAESIGARWEPKLESWVLDYLSPWVDTSPFAQWMPGFVSSHFYLAQSKTRCWKCGSTIPVVAILLPRNALSLDEDAEWGYCDIPTWLSHFSCVSKGTAKTLAAIAPNFRLAYAKTSNSTYYANHCPCCQRLQGEFYLFQEPGGAFCPITGEQAQKIKLKQVFHPFIASGSCGAIPESNFWHCFSFGSDSDSA